MIELEFSIIRPVILHVIEDLQALLDQFEARHHIHVRLTVLEWATSWTDLVKVALYKHGPDVSQVGSTWVSNFVAMNALRPFNRLVVAAMGGASAMQRLLSRRPDAVFVASDIMAVGAQRAIRDADLRVPEDIALASFDDRPFAERSEPPLTTVRQPIVRMGNTAVEMLIDLIEHPGAAPHRIILPTELVVRKSCGSDLQ